MDYPEGANLITLRKREKRKISQVELGECVAIHNEIRLLSVALEEKRARLRECLHEGAEIEDGPLKSFASCIARAKKRKRLKHIPFRRLVVR